MINQLSTYLIFFLFLIPFTLLIFDPFVLFPYITTKALVFRILVTISLPLALIPIFLEPRKFWEIFRKNILLIFVSLFFLSQILATIFSLNPYRSFWGNAERMEGLWSLFFYILYFLILFLLFSLKPETKKTIFLSFLIVSVLISWMEIQQYIVLKAERPSATLGNPTYIGFFNLLNIFIISYFVFGEKRKEIKILLFSLILLNFISLLTSETRGSILGFLLGLTAFSLSYLIFSSLNLRKKLLILGSILACFLLFLAFIFSPLSIHIPGFNRLRETIYNPISVFPRIFAWKIFLNAFLSRPILGFGPETEPIVFFKFFDPKIYEYEAAIFDRPHNKFVQILVNSGLVGFFTWIGIFVSALYLIYKKKEINELQKSSLVAFIFAYLGQNFSLFDMQASYLLFFFGLSLLSEKIEIKFNEEKFIRPYIITIIGISLIFLIFHIQHYYIVRKIISILRTPDPTLASKEFLRISEIAGPFLTEEGLMASSYLIEKLNSINNLEPIENIYQVVKKAYEADKSDARIIGRYAQILKIMINLNYPYGNYQKYLQELKKLGDFSINFYPKHYELRFMFVEMFLSLREGITMEEGGEKKILVLPIKEIDKNELIKKLTEGEIYASNSPRFYVSYLNLLKKLDGNYAYQKSLEIMKKRELLRNEELFSILLDIFNENHDVESLKQLIEFSKNYNFDKKTKEKIIDFEKRFKLIETSSKN